MPYLVLLWCEDNVISYLHAWGNLHADRSLACDGEIRRFLPSYTEMVGHGVKVPEFEREFVTPVWLELLKADLGGERLEESLVDTQVTILQSQQCN